MRQEHKQGEGPRRRWEPEEGVDHVGWYPKGKRGLKWEHERSDLHFDETDVVPSGLEGHECGWRTFTPILFHILGKLVLQDSLGLSQGFLWSCHSVTHGGWGSWGRVWHTDPH